MNAPTNETRVAALEVYAGQLHGRGDLERCWAARGVADRIDVDTHGANGTTSRMPAVEFRGAWHRGLALDAETLAGLFKGADGEVREALSHCLAVIKW